MENMVAFQPVRNERRQLPLCRLRSHERRKALFGALAAEIAFLPWKQRLISLVQIDSLREEVAQGIKDAAESRFPSSAAQLPSATAPRNFSAAKRPCR